MTLCTDCIDVITIYIIYIKGNDGVHRKYRLTPCSYEKATVVWLKLILTISIRLAFKEQLALTPKRHESSELFLFRENCSNVIHSNVIHKFESLLIFPYVYNIL